MSPLEAGVIGIVAFLFLLFLGVPIAIAMGLVGLAGFSYIVTPIRHNVLYLILGALIDAMALVLLTVPIFYPVVVNTLHYDPLWFGVIIVMVVIMGVITPPVGMNVFVVKGLVKDVPLETIFRGIWPFLIAAIVGCAILIAFPQIATFLPRLLMN